VRSLARDLGRLLGCFGHVSALRRTAVGPFRVAYAIGLDRLAASAAEGGSAFACVLQPVAAGLQGLPALAVSRADAARLARGQTVLLRGRDAPLVKGLVAVSTHGSLVALAEVAQGELRPRRVFNASGTGIVSES
jgi:tRNA pseudouridine55 synthase